MLHEGLEPVDLLELALLLLLLPLGNWVLRLNMRLELELELIELVEEGAKLDTLVEIPT